MEREKEWVGNRERGRGTERESQKPRGVEKVREQSDRRTGADRASFSDAQRAAPTSTLYAPHTGLLGTLWESPVRKHRRPSAFLSISVHLLDCSSPLSSGDPAYPSLRELGWSRNGTQEALGWAALTAMLTHLLTHQASDVTLLGAQDHRGS